MNTIVRPVPKARKAPTPFQLYFNQERQLARMDLSEGALVYDKQGNLRAQRVRFPSWHVSRLRCALIAFRNLHL